MGGALTGIHVLDLTDDIAGQFCARMLADYGAEVVLVEPPEGSLTRQAGAVLFRHLNTGKKRAVPAAMAKLAAEADVILVGAAADRSALAALAPPRGGAPPAAEAVAAALAGRGRRYLMWLWVV